MSSILNMTYKVYLLEYLRFHKNYRTIFVQMNPDESGQTFQVTGNMQEGMEYSQNGPMIPDKDPTLIAKHLVGTVNFMDYAQINQICRQIAPPAKQFDGAKRIDPGVPLRTFMEWVKEVIEALHAQGVLVTENN